MFKFVLYMLAGAILLFPLTSSAADFRDFRIPSHKVHQWSAGGALRYGHRAYDTQYDSGSNRDEQIRTTADGSTTWLWESERQRTYVRGVSNLESMRSSLNYVAHRNTLSELPDNSSSTHQRTVREVVACDMLRQCYPWRQPLGISAHAFGQLPLQQYFSTSHSKHYDDSLAASNWSTRRESWSNNYLVEGDIGLVWGRVRNATGIYNAYVVEERLMATGSLSGTLNRQTIQQLADLFYRIGDYQLSHLRPVKYYWADFWAILKQDPAVKPDAENAYNAYRLAEAMVWGDFIRETGWTIGPLLRGSHIHSIGRSSYVSREILYADSGGVQDSLYESSNRREWWSDKLWLGGALELHKPVGKRWQLDLKSSALVSLNDTVKGLLVSNVIEGRYIIADRWLAELSLEHSRTIDQIIWASNPSSRPVTSNWGIVSAASLIYFVEDRWHISADLQQQQFETTDRSAGLRFLRAFTMNIGIVYGPRLSVPRFNRLFYFF